MEHEQEFTVEEILEERRRAWITASAAYAPVPAVPGAVTAKADPVDFLENTVPLPRYRPERL